MSWSENPSSHQSRAPPKLWSKGKTATPDSDSESDEVSIKSTRSYAAHNLQCTFENGRRYCDDMYFMPNDETELTRLNVVHQIYLILLEGRLTAAPLTSEAPRILDVGTGPGDWAIEMSAAWPTATIIATDISVFDSGLGHLSLPNVSFQLADATSEWTYHEPFDLVHMRGLSGAFQDWPALYRQAFTHLKPGGYIEIADTDPAADTISFPHSHTSYLHLYASTLRSVADAAGFPRDLRHLGPDTLSTAGFIDINVHEHTIPIGLWPENQQQKTLGKMALIALLEGLEAYALRSLTRTRDWTAAAARDLCEKVKHELLNTDNLTARVRIVTARKPIAYAQRREEVLARVMRKAGLYEQPDYQE